MNRKKFRAVLEILLKNIKNPSTELIYKTPFELLISVMLSAHSTDVAVNKATAVLFQKANTPKKILRLGINELKYYIKSIGLYNAKASNIMKTCGILIEKYNSKIPCDRQKLMALPGIGRKSANVILNVVYDMPTIGVDTHIFRVCNRAKIATGKTPLKVEEKLLSIVPKDLAKYVHHLLVLYGRYVCKAKNFTCSKCVISDLCEFKNKNN